MDRALLESLVQESPEAHGEAIDKPPAPAKRSPLEAIVAEGIERDEQRAREDRRTIPGHAWEAVKGVPRGVAGWAGGTLQGSQVLVDSARNVFREGAGDAPLKRPSAEGPIHKAGLSLIEAAQKVAPLDPDYEGAMTVQTGEAMGSIVGLAVPAGAVGAAARQSAIRKGATKASAKTAARAGQFGTAAPLAASAGTAETYERARAYAQANPELGISERDIQALSSRRGPLAGVIEIATLGPLLRYIPEPAKKRSLAYLVRRMAEAGVTEYTVENAGQVIQNLAERTYNPDHSIWNEIPESGEPAAYAAALLQAIVFPFLRTDSAPTSRKRSRDIPPASQPAADMPRQDRDGDNAFDLDSLYDEEVGTDPEADLQDLADALSLISQEATPAETARDPAQQEPAQPQPAAGRSLLEARSEPATTIPQQQPSEGLGSASPERVEPARPEADQDPVSAIDDDPSPARTYEWSESQSGAAQQDPAQPAPTRQPKKPEPVESPAPRARVQPAAVGQPARVRTSRGDEPAAQWALVEADQLIVSHSPDGRANPDFPQDLQPRDRSRVASQQQIQQMARAIRPEELGDTGRADQGAPVIGPDGVVESGNARSVALRAAYEQGEAGPYREWLEQQAASLGLDAGALAGMKSPVLVRQRTEDLDPAARARFTRDANVPDVARMSPSEQARADSAAISDEMMSMYAPDESGNVLAAANRPFLDAFARELGEQQTAGLVDAQGRWNKSMADRVRAAVFAKAYGDPRLVDAIAEDADPSLRNVLNALQMAAPAFARARAIDPTLGHLDILTPLVEGVEIVRQSRSEGRAVKEIVSQSGMFGDVSEAASTAALFMDRHARSAKRMGEAFTKMAEYTETALRSAQNESLFGDSAPDATVTQAFDQAIQDTESRHAAPAQTDRLQADQPSRVRSRPESRDQGRQPAAESGRAPADNADQAAEEVTSPVDQAASETDAAPTGGDIVSQLQSMSEEQFLEMFDQIEAEMGAAETEKPVTKRGKTSTTESGKKKPRRQKSKAELEKEPGTDAATERGAAEIAKSAGVNLTNAGKNALKGLDELFGGPGRLNSGLSFDPETYAKAKPHFEQMLKDFQAAGKDVADFIRALIKRYGTGVRPYALQFAREQREQQSEASESADLVGRFAEYFSDPTNSFRTITNARGYAETILGREVKPGTADAKMVDEAVESGVVQAAREIVEASRSRGPSTTYQRLVDLYSRQPNLSTRTSTSVAQQAYSTPVPLAYLASELAGINRETTVYEPTAGNGALVMAADPAKVAANELNAERAATLANTLPGAQVSSNDASEWLPPGKFDAVIANPPFGTVRDDSGATRRFQVDARYETGEIDHAIAIKALDAMKDDGKAVLIVGSVAKTAKSEDARSDAYNSKAKREFYLTLYGAYNVTDHFTVSGDLYAKQGAGWPVDVIVIRGRGKSQLKVPAANPPRQYDSWDALSEVLDGRTAEQDRSAGRETPRTDPQRAEPDRSDAGDRGTGGAEGARGQRPGDRAGESGAVRPGSVDGQPDASRPAQSQPRGATGTDRDRDAAGSDRPDAVTPTAEAPRQLPYEPGSTAASLSTLVPVNMQESIRQALARFKKRHGDIDTYVADRLGYEAGQLSDYFGAEQVDAIALGLDNMERGAGFIIGDQTGIGKGRVVAAVIRYAMRSGRTPVFVTEKPNLYGDMFRDLNDIGIQDMLGRAPEILMTNAAATVPLDESGKVLKTGSAAAHNKLLTEIAEAGQLDGYDMVFTTYSQMQTLKGEETARMRFLDVVGRDGIVIFDESHNAGGTGGQDRSRGPKKEDMNRATFARKLAMNAHGVFYSSATYAKRPDVMDLYATTDMRLAVSDITNLAEAIRKGGVPMQQAVASMLTGAGQYVRRERSFDGISYNSPTVEVSRETYAAYSSALAMVQNFSEQHVKDAVKAIDNELKAEGSAVSHDGATGGAGASSTSFTSVMHNLIDQMLVSIKADQAAERAIAAIKRGEKPVITVANTMGSFIQDYVEETGARSGDRMSLTFNSLLERYLERSRRITVRTPFMKKGEKGEQRYLTDAELGPSGVKAYNDYMAFIREMDLGDLPVSPIDHIHHRLREAGYKIGEITGRTATLDYRGDGTYYQLRPSKDRSIAGRRKAIAEFNDGTLDAMIINQAGSTGLSLHASEKFKDRRKRRMIIAQAEKNIDTHMQMLGRVHRTGQVVLPEYDQLVADVPAEKRPAAVLAKKMASLNANTTAARDSALKAKDVPDFMNEYGDVVAARLMYDFPEIHAKIGSPLTASSDGFESAGAMRKVTGRIPLLTIADQEALYETLEAEYDALLQQKEAAGESVLEAKTLNLDPQNVEREQVIAPQAGDSPFADGVYVEVASVRRLGKPHTSQRVRELIAEELGMEVDAIDAASMSEQGRAAARRLVAETEDAVKAYRQEVLDELSGEKARDALEDRLSGQWDRFRAILRTAHVGAPVVLKTDESNLYGIVIRVHRTGKAKNPTALGTWKVTLALADASRQITLPMSPLYTNQNAPSAQVGGAIIVEPSPKVLGTPMLDAFDELQTDSREKRTLITGNMLAGFDHVGGRGTIINFLEKGKVRQGILMPKDYDYKAAQSGRSVPFRSADQVITFADMGHLAVSSDGAVEITAVNGAIRIEIAASKSRGGKYFLDRGLIEAAGQDFVTVGNKMRADIPRARASAAIEQLKRLGAGMEARADLDAARGVAGSVSGTEGGNVAEEGPYYGYERDIPSVQDRKRARRADDAQIALDLEPPDSVPAARTQARDNFLIHYRRVPTGQFPVGLDTVTTPEEAAHVFAPIRKRAEEVFMALVLDDNGKILDLQMHGKGVRDGATVEPSIVIPAVAAVPGAARVYFAHNHPSGIPNRSRADQRITDALVKGLDGTGIRFDGHVVVTVSGKIDVIQYDQSPGAGETISQVQPRPRNRSQSVTERMVRKIPSESPMMVTDSSSAAVVARHIESPNALILMNTRHQVVASIALTQPEMAALKKHDQVNRILTAIDTTNAGAAIIKFSHGNARAARNLATYLNGGDRQHGQTAPRPRVLRVLDAITQDSDGNWVSTAANMQNIHDARHDIFYSRPGDMGASVGSQSKLTAEQVSETIADVVLTWADGPFVDVVDSWESLPRHLAEQVLDAEAFDAAGVYDAGTGTVFLMADQIRSKNHALKTLAHDAVGHYGMETMLGDEYGDILDRVRHLKSTNPRIRKIAEGVRRAYGSGISESVESSEIIAKMAEEGIKHPILTRIYAAIRQFLRRLGFRIPFSATDLNAMIVRAERMLVTGRGAGSGRGGPRADTSARFSRGIPPDMEGADSMERQAKGQKAFGKGQPIDRMFRMLFDVTGMVDSAGRLKAGMKLEAGVKRALLESSFKPDGMMAWMNPAIETVRAGLIDRYGLDADFIQREQEAKSDEARILAAGEEFLKRLADAKVGPAEARALQAILTGEEVGDAALNALAAPIREAIDQLGQEMVSLGLLEADTYSRHVGAYLHRSYTKHQQQLEGLPKWAHNVLRKHRRKIHGDELRARGLKEDVDTERLLRDAPRDWWGSKLKAGEADKRLRGTEWLIFDRLAPIGEGTATAPGIEEGGPRKRRRLQRVFWPADQAVPARFQAWENRGKWEVTGTKGSKLRLRRDFTKEEREAMGEILDARYNLIKTYQLMAHDVANGRFFRDIAKNPDWSVDEAKSGEKVANAEQARRLSTFAGVDWVRVPSTKIGDTGKMHWGDLGGRLVRPEIWRDLNELDRMQKPGTWRAILTQWKTNKTARSPVVHMNNVMSNLVLMDLIDVRLSDLVRGIQEYRSKGEMFQEAREHGAFGAGFVQQELNRNLVDPMLDEVMKEARSTRDDVEGRTRLLSKLAYGLWEAAKKADRTMTNFYQTEDELFRMATYMRHRGLGASAQEAATIAREQFLNYDIRAPWVNALRESVLPFISYTYRAVPAIATAIAHRPWKIAKYAAIGYLANLMAYELEPGDKDEERRTMRDAQQGMTWASIPFTDIGVHRMMRLPLKDQHENPLFIDVYRWIPAGDVFDTNQGQIGLPAWFQFGGPMQLAFEMVLNRSAFTGRDIVDRQTDTFTEAGEKRLDYLWKAWMPSAAYVPGSWHYDKLKSAMKGERDILGRPYSVPGAILSGVGVKAQPHDVQMGYYFRNSDIQRKMRALQAQVRQLSMDEFRNIGTEESRQAEIEVIRRKMRELQKQQMALQGKE